MTNYTRKIAHRTAAPSSPVINFTTSSCQISHAISFFTLLTRLRRKLGTRFLSHFLFRSSAYVSLYVPVERRPFKATGILPHILHTRNTPSAISLYYFTRCFERCIIFLGSLPRSCFLSRLFQRALLYQANEAL